MPLIMQGNWTVSIKGKNAAFPQRFIISGAATGNDTYVTPHAPVNVTSNTWSLRIQSDPVGDGSWTDSEYQITYPVKVGTQYQFDLQSNDVWPGDKDFNDLVLTLSTAVAETDFLIYGNVSSYANCWYNPCYPTHIVLETERALDLARRYESIREVLEKYYPREQVRWPIPLPDPPPDVPVSVLRGPAFKPILIPLQENTRLPASKALVVKNAVQTRKADAKAEVKAASPTQIMRTVNLYEPQANLIELDKARLNELVQGSRVQCEVEPLVNTNLRFLEYDRTVSEKLGSDYTGEGPRETLGLATTDRNGNYIFRFSRSVDQFIDEAETDRALGEDEHLEKMPDLIIQVLGALLPDGKQYETVPYWNTSHLKRINICVPSSYWYTPNTNCGGKPISHIGFIPVGKKSAVTLDAEGRVTCTDTSKADIPQTQCAAWGGYLRMNACLGKYDRVTTYTIEYRTKPKGGYWPATWKPYRETLKLDNWNSTLSDWAPKSVGPFLHNLEIEKGQPKQDVWGYNNIQGNMDWSGNGWFLKAIIPSWLYNDPSGPGPVQFRLKGYDKDGNQVVLWVDPGTSTAKYQDVITLYIDNNPPELGYTAPTIGTPVPGNTCPLFTLTEDDVSNATLDFKFKAIHKEGFLADYRLYLGNCSSGNLAIVNMAPDGHVLTESAPTHNPCPGGVAWAYGTLHDVDPSADANNFVAVKIKPASGPWLAASEKLTILTLKLYADLRVTDGHSAYYPPRYGPIYYTLVIQR